MIKKIKRKERKELNTRNPQTPPITMVVIKVSLNTGGSDCLAV